MAQSVTEYRTTQQLSVGLERVNSNFMVGHCIHSAIRWWTYKTILLSLVLLYYCCCYCCCCCSCCCCDVAVIAARTGRCDPKTDNFRNLLISFNHIATSNSINTIITHTHTHTHGIQIYIHLHAR